MSTPQTPQFSGNTPLSTPTHSDDSTVHTEDVLLATRRAGEVPLDYIKRVLEELKSKGILKLNPETVRIKVLSTGGNGIVLQLESDDQIEFQNVQYSPKQLAVKISVYLAYDQTLAQESLVLKEASARNISGIPLFVYASPGIIIFMEYLENRRSLSEILAIPNKGHFFDYVIKVAETAEEHIAKGFLHLDPSAHNIVIIGEQIIYLDWGLSILNLPEVLLNQNLKVHSEQTPFVAFGLPIENVSKNEFGDYINTDLERQTFNRLRALFQLYRDNKILFDDFFIAYSRYIKLFTAFMFFANLFNHYKKRTNAQEGISLPIFDDQGNLQGDFNSSHHIPTVVHQICASARFVNEVTDEQKISIRNWLRDFGKAMADVERIDYNLVASMQSLQEVFA